MPLFIIERNYAEKLEVSPELAGDIVRVNADTNVNWVFSFLSADKKKTYCLYEAVSAEAIQGGPNGWSACRRHCRGLWSD